MPGADASAAGANLLLIEDDNLIAESVTMLLHTLTPHTVTVAGTGRQTRQLLADGLDPDLLLLDLRLPDTDGITLLRTLRQTGYTLPVVVLSAQPASRDRTRGDPLGVVDWLVKPVTADTLLAALRQALPDTGRPESPA